MLKYILDGDGIWSAYIKDGVYNKPSPVPGSTYVPKPTYWVIARKGDLLVMIDYFNWEQAHNSDSWPLRYLSSVMLLHVRALVKPGDPVPADLLLAGNPRAVELERELDIIRGKVPTPKGYKIDKTKVKKLQAELNRLRREAGVGSARTATAT